MKDKVLLNVLLPATGRSYEFRVPFDLTVDEASQLMARILASQESERYAADGTADLMVVGNVPAAGEQLNPNETFRALVEQGALVDGSAVALA